MGIFDIMGPIMIGPSSSHTAGAARIGLFARNIFARPFKKATITLYNSFNKTGKGHGTDKAIMAGLMGMKKDDERIREAPKIAVQKGYEFTFILKNNPEIHPNSVKINIYDEKQKEDFSIRGVSVGGGKIKIVKIKGHNVDFGGTHHTIIVHYKDKPGMIGKIGKVIGEENVNIAYMQVSRDISTEETMALLKLDSLCSKEALKKIKEIENILYLTQIKKLKA